MSKRRKNAGEGYGYMFSGAFAKKADAVKKEAKRKGSFVKSIYVQGQHRYAVMTPRTNPIKRKKKPAAATVVPAQTNPAELLVMGANPPEREFTVPPGTTITIRTNPEPNPLFSFHPAMLTGRQQRAHLGRTPFNRRVAAMIRKRRAFLPDEGKYKALKKSARAAVPKTEGRVGRKPKLNELFHELYGRDNPICGKHIGNELCTRKPGHRGPCLPQGATMRTRTRLKRGWQPNPSAATLRETFTGAPADRFSVYDEPHMPAGDYAKLGELLSLYIKPHGGGQVQEIRAKDRPTVVVDETARQIYFVGGDQDISSALAVFGPVERGAGVFEIGEARRIDYQQRKEHVAKPEDDKWKHHFGEESGVMPKVLYNVHTKRLLLEGGEYVIRAEGIIN
jgi:hypothetical protein